MPQYEEKMKMHLNLRTGTLYRMLLVQDASGNRTRIDSERFASRGEHNLVRARGQLDLQRQLRPGRAERARILAL